MRQTAVKRGHCMAQIKIPQPSSCGIDGVKRPEISHFRPGQQLAYLQEAGRYLAGMLPEHTQVTWPLASLVPVRVMVPLAVPPRDCAVAVTTPDAYATPETYLDDCVSIATVAGIPEAVSLAAASATVVRAEDAASITSETRALIM